MTKAVTRTSTRVARPKRTGRRCFRANPSVDDARPLPGGMTRSLMATPIGNPYWQPLLATLIRTNAGRAALVGVAIGRADFPETSCKRAAPRRLAPDKKPL